MQKRCFMLLLLGLFGFSMQAQNALLFDGVKHFALVQGSKSLNLNANDFAIQIMVSEPDFRASDTLTLLSYQSADTSLIDGYQLLLTSNQILFQIGATYYGVNHTVSGCEHLTIQRLGSKLEFYADSTFLDVLSIANGVSLSCASCDLLIGKSVQNNNYYHGRIDELRIWKTALNSPFLETSIQRCLNAVEIANTNLLSYWDFDEVDGQFANNKAMPSRYARLGTSFYADGADPERVAPTCPISVCCQLSAAMFNVSDSVIAVNEVPTFTNSVAGADSVLWIVNNTQQGTANTLSMSLPMGMNIVQLVIYSGTCKAIQTQLIDVVAGFAAVCGADGYLQLAKNNPKYTRTWQMLQNAPTQPVAARRIGTPGIYYIPVVFHVIADNSSVFADFPLARIQSQLNFVNTRLQPANIQICLAQKLPDGSTNWQQVNPINGVPGITYTVTSNSAILNYNAGDTVAGGALEALLWTQRPGFSSEEYLNIYILPNIQDPLNPAHALDGVSSVGPSGAPADGVGVVHDAFAGGNGGTALGVTLIHEIGHWLGLLHTFSQPSDYICDTYYQSQSSLAAGVTGCSTPYTNTLDCAGNSYLQGQNYMDYFYESCQNQFSAVQIARMHHVLDHPVGRSYIHSLVNLANTGIIFNSVSNPAGCVAGVSDVIADFSVSGEELCIGNSITLTGARVNYDFWQFSLNWNTTLNNGQAAPQTPSFMFLQHTGTGTLPSTAVDIQTPGVWDIELLINHQGQSATATRTVTILDCTANADRYRQNVLFADTDWAISGMSIDNVIPQASDIEQGYIIAGSADISTPTSRTVGAVIRTNLAGEILWRKTIDAGIDEDIRLLDVASNIDFQGQNCYAFTGMLTTNQKASMEVLLLILDRSGNILHQSSYPISDNGQLPFVHGTEIIQTSAGQFVIAGFAGLGQNDTHKGFIFGVSANSPSNILWTSFYESIATNYRDYDIVKGVTETFIDFNQDGTAESALIVNGDYSFDVLSNIRRGAFFQCITIDNANLVTERWRKNLHIDEAATGDFGSTNTAITNGRIFAVCNSDLAHGSTLFELDALTGNLSDFMEMEELWANRLIINNGRCVISGLFRPLHSQIASKLLVAGSVSVPPIGFTIFPNYDYVFRVYENTTSPTTTIYSPTLGIPNFCFDNIVPSPSNGYMIVNENNTSNVRANTIGYAPTSLLLNKIDNYLTGACANTLRLRLGTLVNTLSSPIFNGSSQAGVTYSSPAITAHSENKGCEVSGCEPISSQLPSYNFQKCTNGTVVLNNLYSPGSGSFNYTWLPSIGLNNASVLSPTCSATTPTQYQFSVTDANSGCLVYEATASVTMSSYWDYARNISCNGLDDGEVAIISGDEIPPYSYTWSDGSQLFYSSGLSAGVYSVTAVDGIGCSYKSTLTVAEPSALSISESSILPTCYGAANGSISLSVNGGQAPYSYWWANGEQTSSISGLAAGVYYVTIIDAGFCVATKTISVSNPSFQSVSLLKADVSCTGQGNGSATVVSNAASTYYWSNGATSSSISGLGGGVYTVTVTDINNCKAVGSTTILEPLGLQIIFNKTDISCYGTATGQVTAAVSGGAAPYFYVWSNGNSTASNTNLVAGTYVVTVTDANGCQSTNTISINQPQALTSTLSATQVVCNGSNTGAASVLISGGVAPYNYRWSTGETTSSITGISSGLYGVTITDANQCNVSASTTITEPQPLIVHSSLSNARCFGLSDGSISTTVSGGTFPYNYIWSNNASNQTNANTGLPAGNYALTITDGNNCRRVELYTITEPTQLIVSSNALHISCYGNNSGQATVNAVGGIQPYGYVWSNGQQTPMNTGLTAGIYTVTTTDANNCLVINQVTITQPQLLVANLVATDAICNGSATGAATATVAGGISPYRYLWSNGVLTFANANLSAGAYSLTVTDANDCSVINSITVNQPSAVTVAIQSSNVSCNGGANGTASALMNGGTTPYVYLWSNGATTSAITGLTPAQISVTVTDANQCISIGYITITEPQSLIPQLSQIDVACNGQNTGQAALSVAGGIQPYSYAWNNNNSTAINTGLIAGIYVATVTDANSCTAVSAFTITEPTQLQVNIINFNHVSCNGANDGAIIAKAVGGADDYIYLWSNGETVENLDNLNGGVYSITVTDRNNCIVTNQVTITEPSAIQTTTTQTNVSCNGDWDGSLTFNTIGGVLPYSYLWSNGVSSNSKNGLTTGVYSATITDANGCINTAQATITEPAQLQIIANQQNVSCEGGSDGSIILIASGGTTPYTYQWSSNQTTNSISGLIAGGYTVTVTDANGCSKTIVINITEPSRLSITNTITNVLCYGGNNGTIVANAIDGTAPYTYLWSNSRVVATNTGLTAGVYTVTVTDSKGCIAIQNITLSQPTILNISMQQMNQNCNTSADGKLVANCTGGILPYTYLWSNGRTTAMNSGLSAGVYTVTITDANACSIQQSATLTAPTQLAISFVNVPAQCNGSANGQSTVNPAGGTSPYNYAWSNGRMTATNTGLSAGIYTVTITDANGCSKTQSTTITQPSILTAQLVSSVAPTCYNGTNGTFSIQASGGTPNYSFNRGSGAQATGVFSNVAAGIHNVTVTDANGCTVTQSVSISQPAAIGSTMTTTSTACIATATGSVSVTISGATANRYAWSNGATTASITGVPAGAYCVTVSTTNGCTVSNCATVSLPSNYISVTKTSSVSAVTLGSTFNYVITARRGSCAGNYPVVIADVLPAGLQYISATTTSGTIQYVSNGGAANAGTVSANISSLAANASATVTITVRSIGGVLCGDTTRYSNIATATVANQTYASAANIVKMRDATLNTNGASCIIDSINLSFQDAISSGILRPSASAANTIQNVVINGKWRLTGAYTFAPGSTIKMMTGAEIVLETGATLDLSGVTVTGCNCLWKQILAQKQSNIITNNTQIYDAQYAIQAEHQAVLSIGNTTFRNNFVGIYTALSSITNTVTMTFTGSNIFESAGANLKRPFTTIASTPAFANGSLIGVSPILGQKGMAAMYLSNLASVNIQNVGNSANNLMSGIIALGVNDLTLRNFNFSQLQQNTSYNANIDWQGTGVYGLGSANNTLPYNAVTQSMDIQQCTFDACKNGIVAKQTNTRFIINTMSNIGYSGIAVLNAKNSTMGIEANQITSNYFGVMLVSNEPTILTRVFQNNITLNQATVTGDYPPTAIAIFDNNIASTNPANIGANKITLANMSHWGILAYQTNGLNIYSNAIAMKGTLPTAGVFRAGIVSLGSSNISIRCNDVNKSGISNMPTPDDNTNVAETYGIYSMSSTGELRCNSVDKTYTGILIDQPGAMQLITNIFKSHKFGLYLNSTAAIGAQLYNGNRWLTATVPTGGSLAYNAGNTASSRFDVLVNASVPNPTEVFPNPSFVTSNWFYSNSTGASSNVICDRLDNLINQTCFELRSTSLETELTDLDATVAENTFATREFAGNSLFIAQRQLLEKLEHYPNHVFANRFQNSNVQRFMDIKRLVRNAYTLSAQETQRLTIFRQDILSLQDSMRIVDSLLQINHVQSALQATRNNIAARLSDLIDQQQSYIESQRSRVEEMIDRAYSLNEQIQAVETYEIHEQIVNSIYLQTFARGKFNLSDEQKAILKSIAIRCPWSDGNAILQARTMLGTESPVWILDASACQNTLIADNHAAENMTVSLAPNPTSSTLTINITGNTTEVPSIEVFDMLGRMVQTEQLSANPVAITMNVSHLAQGMYMVKLQYANASITKPFVVIKQ